MLCESGWIVHNPNAFCSLLWRAWWRSLDPVAEMDEVASSLGQPESPLGGGEVDMTEGDKAAEAIADKSDADAHKVLHFSLWPD